MRVLTSEQIEQVINNTMVVMLLRPDLLQDWHKNLLDLLKQARESHLDEESIFVAAVLTLLYCPEDTLPTGTTYDPAWQSLLTALRTGVRPPAATEGEEMSLDRLLGSVTEALIAVMTQATDRKDIMAEDLGEMRSAASKAQMPDMVRWLDDVLAVLTGTSPRALADHHQGVYATYWEIITRNLQRGD